jgi:DNA-directed RNA polymerase subunit alpha
MSTRIPLIAADEQKRSLNERLEMSTAEIGLSVRTTNCLEDRGIFTVHDLLNCTRADLLSISNFGEKTLEEVYAALENVGFYRTGRAPRGDQVVNVRRPRATSARLRPDLHAD